MNQPLLSDLRALWFVRSRVIFLELGYWMILLGYDLRLKRFTNRIYLVYTVIFFSIWIFALLALLADFGARLLRAIAAPSPVAAAALVGVVALLALFLVELFQATNRSPFSFSDEDALHFCTSPIDRRPVCLEWLLEAWVRSELAVGAVSVVLAYSVVETLAAEPLTLADLPMYIFSGARMILVAAPLYLGMKSIAWTAGAWRLRGMVEPVNIRWISLALLIFLAAGLFLLSPQLFLTGLYPLTLVILAGLGQAPWGAGLAAALLLTTVGLAALWRVSEQVSLARAAQEARERRAVAAAIFTGNTEIAQELRQQKRLRSEQTPSRFPTGSGVTALLWKNAVQALRRAQVSDILPWLGLFGLALTFALLPNWGTRIWSLVMWVLLAQQQMIRPLRRELARWWLIRQLPFRSEVSITAMLALPVVRVWLGGLAGFGTALLFGAELPLEIFWLYLVTVPCIGLAAAWHILRQAKTQELIAGRIPDLGLLGVLLGVLIFVFNGMFTLMAQVLPGFLAWILVVGEGVGVSYLLWMAVGDKMRGLK